MEKGETRTKIIIISNAPTRKVDRNAFDVVTHLRIVTCAHGWEITCKLTMSQYLLPFDFQETHAFQNTANI